MMKTVQPASHHRRRHFKNKKKKKKALNIVGSDAENLSIYVVVVDRVYDQLNILVYRVELESNKKKKIK